MKVIKRDCTEVEFDKTKIYNAIMKSMENGSGIIKPKIAEDIANEIYEENKDKNDIEIYEIEKQVFDKLITKKQRLTARAYEGYRSIREFQRDNQTYIDDEMNEMIGGNSDYWNNENSNKDAKKLNVRRDYMAGITSKDLARKNIFTPDMIQAHDDGIIHINDMDYRGMRNITNCCLINLEDMLNNGTVINGVKINNIHRIWKATTIATQIITAVASSQYGGCSISLTHLAPFVRMSYNKYIEKYRNRGLSEQDCIKYAKDDLNEEIRDSVKTFNYQINSMSTTNGQAPFVTVFMYLGETDEYKEELAMLIEEFLNQRIKGMPNEKGVYITQAFPKLLYVTEEDNIHKDSKYWYLTELAALSTSKRMNPDYVSEKIMKKLKEGNCFPQMGCRSCLSPWKDENGNYKFYGRFNCGVVTLNLVDVALSSEGDENVFWDLLDRRLQLVHDTNMRCFDYTIKGTNSDVAPIIWQYGAFGRLNKHEKIDKLLYGGYATISCGYAGLYECVKYMTGESHSSGKGYEFGIKIMQRMHDLCEQWKKEDNIGWGVYGTPIESTTYKFAKALKKRFGDDVFVRIDGNDRNYITNSYHVNVREKINPFDKLSIESKYQALSSGGAVSYIEAVNLEDNIKAVLEVIKFMYENIMYAEINTKSDYCQVCGYDKEIKIISENNKLIWECPNCGNRDKDKMNVARRTCGYIGTNYWNEGRTGEINERYVHLDNFEVYIEVF